MSHQSKTSGNSSTGVTAVKVGTAGAVSADDTAPGHSHTDGDAIGHAGGGRRRDLGDLVSEPGGAQRLMAAVELAGVSKRYGDVAAVRDFTLEVAPGELLVLLGPSGCGKSTVLRLVAGLERPSEGTVLIGGKVVNDVDPMNRDVAMVFQSYALYPHLSVRQNIEFPLRSRRSPAKRRRELVGEVARGLQLEELLDRKPAQLSGGQRQRVALARAIVRRPAAFLLDEPLSNLDAQLRVEMRAELVELHARLGTTSIYVTHDQVEAITMGQRIAVMYQGRLQQVGAPRAVYERPANAFVAGFVGHPPMNVLPARVGGEAAIFAGGQIPLGPELAARVRRSNLDEVLVGVKPEDLRPDPEGTVSATVVLLEDVGGYQQLSCRLSTGQLVGARAASRRRAFRTGDEIMLSALGELHLFAPSTGERLGP